LRISRDHVFADQRIVEYLRKNQYHPRSDKHGQTLCRYFLEDLLFESAILRKAAFEGKLVYNEDCTIGQGALCWTIDLILGSPPQGRFFGNQNGIAKDEIKDVWLAVDAKSVMTEHGKARRNRQRDLSSLATIVKHYYPRSVVCGLMLVNMSERFVSPLRDGVTYHKNIEKLVKETIDIFNEIPRADIQGGTGIEGVGIIVVDHTNDPRDETKLVTKPPAPNQNDSANYRRFLQTVRMALERRFLT